MHYNSYEDWLSDKPADGTKDILEKKMDDTPRRGSLALCGLGCLGVITQDEPKKVKYKDGNEGVAYVGIHVTNKIAKVGSPWSSRNPKVICGVSDILVVLKILLKIPNNVSSENEGEKNG